MMQQTKGLRSLPEEPMAASQRRLSPRGRALPPPYDLQLVPLPVGVARLMLAGKLRPAPLKGTRPQQAAGILSIRCSTASMRSRWCSLPIGR